MGDAEVYARVEAITAHRDALKAERDALAEQLAEVKRLVREWADDRTCETCGGARCQNLAYITMHRLMALTEGDESDG